MESKDFLKTLNSKNYLIKVCEIWQLILDLEDDNIHLLFSQLMPFHPVGQLQT